MDSKTAARLDQIDRIASSSDPGRLTEALNLCIRLPDTPPTAELRAWAKLELRGYGETPLPSYRIEQLQPFCTTSRVRNAPLPLPAVPEYLREHLAECRFALPLETLMAMANDPESTKMAPPSMPEIVQHLTEEGQVEWPHVLQEVFWLVPPSVVSGIIGGVVSELGHRIDLIERPDPEPQPEAPSHVPSGVFAGDHSIINFGDNASSTVSSTTQSPKSGSIDRWTLASRWATVLMSAVAIAVSAYVAYRWR